MIEPWDWGVCANYVWQRHTIEWGPSAKPCVIEFVKCGVIGVWVVQRGRKYHPPGVETRRLSTCVPTARRVGWGGHVPGVETHRLSTCVPTARRVGWGGHVPGVETRRLSTCVPTARRVGWGGHVPGVETRRLSTCVPSARRMGAWNVGLGLKPTGYRLACLQHAGWGRGDSTPRVSAI